MDFHFQGVQYLQGQLAVVGAIIAESGNRIPIYLPVGYARTLGCALIELSALANERQSELQRTGELLDVNTLAPEFATRLAKRLELNGSDASVTGT